MLDAVFTSFRYMSILIIAEIKKVSLQDVIESRIVNLSLPMDPRPDQLTVDDVKYISQCQRKLKRKLWREVGEALNLKEIAQCYKEVSIWGLCFLGYTLLLGLKGLGFRAKSILSVFYE